jgi:hypothetical protein
MKDRIAKILLWLFVINLGIAFGAGLYESRIVVPQWLSGDRSPAEAGAKWNAAAAREAKARATQWVTLNHLRHALVLIAWLAALKAFSVLYAEDREDIRSVTR